MARSTAIVVCIYRINGFPYIALRRHTHDEPFVVPHIHRRHLNCDPQCRESEEQKSIVKKQAIIY